MKGKEVRRGNYIGKVLNYEFEDFGESDWKTFQIEVCVSKPLKEAEYFSEVVLKYLESRLQEITNTGHSVFSVELTKHGTVGEVFKASFLVIARKNKQCHLRKKLRLLRKRSRS